MDIKEFLQEIGLEYYISIFIENAVDMETLLTLTEEEMKEELGMKLGHRKKLRAALEKLEKYEIRQPLSLQVGEMEKFPSILAVPIFEYMDEENPKIKLWAICDFFELYMRFHVIAGLAHIKSKKGTIPEKLLIEIKHRIEHPTLGKWIGMACSVGKYMESSHLLQSFYQKMTAFLDEGDYSILKLRNQLAHGGGISQKAAKNLLEKWDPCFQSLIKSFEQLKHCHLVVRSSDGDKLVQLSGPHADSYSEYHPASDSIREGIETLLDESSAVVLVIDEEVITLWPLIFYRNQENEKKAQQNIYVRRGDISLEYTPIGSDDSFQSQSDQDALKHFSEFFQIRHSNEQDVEKRLIVRSFLPDILSDARRLVGRERELSKIRAELHARNEGVFWLTGHAGIGKSYLTATITKDFLESPLDYTLVMPYRFKAGDDRCYRHEFIIFAVERLNHWDGTEKKVTKQPTAYNVKDLQQMLHSIKKDHQVIFVIDGFDELPSQDMKLAGEIINDLQVPSVKWLCSGRPNVYLEETFTKDNCCRIFPEGVPPMSKEDVLSMILEKIGPLRKKLIKNDIDKTDEEVMNPFIEKVWVYSEGIPLYVTYVVGDILSNRIKHFDGENDALPPSIYNYHQELLRRCSIDIYHQVLPRIVSTIAIAKEALSFEFLEDLLMKQDLLPKDRQQSRRIIHQSLTYVASMLKRINILDGTKEGYTLYHTSLRDYMEGPEAILLQTARNSLIKLLRTEIDSPTEVDSYLFRWGITHLLEDQESDHMLKVEELLSSYPYLQAKSEHQKLEFFFDDLFNGYQKVTETSDGMTILKVFLHLFVAMEKEGKVSIETLHALFVYQEDQRFYEQLLWMATNKKIDFQDEELANSFEQLYPSFLSRLANFQRRNGQLEKAKVLLKRSSDMFEEQKNYSEMARVQYDIAYIHYLQGNYDFADMHFESSKNFAMAIQDEVGFWISKCVQYHSGQFNRNGDKTTADFKQVMAEALPIFRKHAKLHNNENARRWIKNIYAHSFKVAFEEGDVSYAQEMFNKLTENDWMKKYGKSSFIEYEARLRMLEGDYEEAERLFASYLKGDHVELDVESRSKEFLDYAKLLKTLNDYPGVLRIAELGLACPPDFGNRYYIEELQAIYHETKSRLERSE